PIEIVNNILIGSSCIEVSNVQTQGECGLGYFTSLSPSFSFDGGLILRSGMVTATEGPLNNSGKSTTCSQLGDADLQAIIQSYGLNGSINDASFLQFDFIASADFFSFEFIFASNEYGTYQCSFGDSFAFILTDLATGTTQNLAVIPNTNIPVSVVTI